MGDRRSKPGLPRPGCGRSSVLPLYYHLCVPVRKKRSISMPPELDASIEEAAKADNTTYSG
jgi:hypothetical protein